MTTRPVVGDPAVALATESRGADLLVVGHRGHCGHRGSVGSVAERVAGLATVPVLVHRSGLEGPPSAPVLVGLAPGRVDEAVLEFAFAAAARRAVPLHALTVWSDFDAGVDGPVDSRPVVAEASSAIRCWCDKYPGVPVEVVVRHGLDATIALTAATHAAQLAVIGAGGAGTPTQTGSLAHALIHRSACPVVVVPAIDEQRRP
jgi:nucleotide-binding universal stress UspA family protein